eukprot:985267-Prorocentrum_minimum.AAC.2
MYGGRGRAKCSARGSPGLQEGVQLGLVEVGVFLRYELVLEVLLTLLAPQLEVPQLALHNRHTRQGSQSRRVTQLSHPTSGTSA